MQSTETYLRIVVVDDRLCHLWWVVHHARPYWGKQGEREGGREGGRGVKGRREGREGGGRSVKGRREGGREGRKGGKEGHTP